MAKKFLLSLPIDAELDKVLKLAAKQYHLSRADMVRIALRKYFGITTGLTMIPIKKGLTS